MFMKRKMRSQYPLQLTSI